MTCLTKHSEQVFLSKFNKDKIYNDLKTKVENNQELTNEDVMQFIILPLVQKDKRQDLIELTVNLAKEMTDENTQSFIIAGILAATDKFIDKNYSTKIKEWLRMTKVGRLFEEEKLEYAKEREKAKEIEFAKKMMKRNRPIDEIIEDTGLTLEEVESIRNSD